MYILENDTKSLEQVIDVIWLMNILLKFLTPFEQDLQYADRFFDIARHYLFPGFILDVLSTLTILFDYQYKWMYYLKFLRGQYFSRALDILHRAIDPIVTRCNMSK